MMAVSAGRSFLRKNDSFWIGGSRFACRFFWIGGSRSACRFFRIDLLTFFDARNFYGSGSLTRVLPEGRFLTGSHNGSLGVRGRPSKSGAQSARFPGGSASLAAYRQPGVLFNASLSCAENIRLIRLIRLIRKKVDRMTVSLREHGNITFIELITGKICVKPLSSSPHSIRGTN